MRFALRRGYGLLGGLQGARADSTLRTLVMVSSSAASTACDSHRSSVTSAPPATSAARTASLRCSTTVSQSRMRPLGVCSSCITARSCASPNGIRTIPSSSRIKSSASPIERPWMEAMAAWAEEEA